MIADPSHLSVEKCDELLQFGDLPCEPATLIGKKGKQFEVLIEGSYLKLRGSHKCGTTFSWT